MHQILLPLRAQIADVDGHKRIALTINGRITMVLDYDPATNELVEIPMQHEPHDIRQQFPQMETK